jgi:hypothetical protein
MNQMKMVPQEERYGNGNNKNSSAAAAALAP